MNPTRPRLVFLDAATFGDTSLDRFKTHWDCTIHRLSSPDEVAKRLKGCRAIVINKIALDRSLLQLPETRELKLIAVAATGTDRVDLKMSKSRGIGVCNVPGYATHAVAQFTMALILEMATHTGKYGQIVRQGLWQKSPMFTRLDFRSVELHGKTIGIIGYGNIGMAVARMARGMGMRVRVCQRPGTGNSISGNRLPLKDLLAISDIVTLHCPLTAHTRNLMNNRTLALMKPTALLVNTARGALVDETALIQWLRRERGAGAALDVIAEEPPSDENPLLRAARELDNLWVTPHCAWTAAEARERLIKEVAANLRAFLRGKFRNRVV